MLKVFLVEDEYIVREGIKNNIDWNSEGFVFCGEAADGELAYPMIQSEKPDIIITDIKMPFMDGLELSKLIKSEMPSSRIIIISGYEEFSFAQKAIQIGVTEYILKPINSTELLNVVKRVGKQILAEREEKSNYERYKRETEENEMFNRRTLFKQIISGALSLSQILEKGKNLGLELSAQQYNIILVRYSFPTGDKGMAQLESEIGAIHARMGNLLSIDGDIEGLVSILKADNLAQLEETCKEYIDALIALFEKYPSIRYFGGIGAPVSRLTRLAESFESASHAFSLRFILDKNAFVKHSEIASQWTNEDTGSPLGALELGSVNLKKVEEFLRNGKIEETSFFVEGFLNSIGSASEQSFLFRQYVLMDIYSTASMFLKEIEAEGLSSDMLLGAAQFSEVVNDTAMAREYIENIFLMALKQRDEVSSKRYRRMIEQARDYIHEHYMDDEISLNDVAAFVNVSPSHFSVVFSRETGQSFIKYLTDLRIKKAKELLKCSDMRCAEIGMAVGYKDPHYFSYLFKKTQNCTPMQYRTSRS